MPVKDYLKDVNNLKDLQRQKVALRKEVEFSRERLSHEFEDWMEMGRHTFDQGFLHTVFGSMAKFGVRQLKHSIGSSFQQQGLLPDKAGGLFKKVRIWMPILIPLISAVTGFFVGEQENDD